MRKKTHEQFISEIYDLVRDEYSVLDKYEGNKTKIKLKHNACGFEYMMKPNSFLTGQRCPKCFGKPKKTQEQFVSEVYNLVKDEYSVLGEYKNTDTKVTFIHNTCGFKYMAKPDHFLRGIRCPKCFGTPKKTREQFINEVYNLVRDEYSVLGRYETNSKKIKFIHNKCGFEYTARPNDFLAGKRCPGCFGTPRRTQEQFVSEVYNLVKDEYSVIGNYKTNLTKILMKHNTCGFEYMVTPSAFLSKNSRCPQCSESKGEIAIRSYLKDKHIPYKSQYKIEECKNKRSLPFDFAIFNSNKLLALIEYDGIQHFEPIEHFGGIEGYHGRREKDNIKNRFCKTHNIKLIRVPYTIPNISVYLDEKLAGLITKAGEQVDRSRLKAQTI